MEYFAAFVANGIAYKLPIGDTEEGARSVLILVSSYYGVEPVLLRWNEELYEEWLPSYEVWSPGQQVAPSLA